MPMLCPWPFSDMTPDLLWANQSSLHNSLAVTRCVVLAVDLLVRIEYDLPTADSQVECEVS